MPRPPKRGAPGSRAGSGRRGPQTCCRGCPLASSQTIRLIKALVKYATERLVSTDAFRCPRSRPRPRWIGPILGTLPHVDLLFWLVAPLLEPQTNSSSCSQSSLGTCSTPGPSLSPGFPLTYGGSGRVADVTRTRDLLLSHNPPTSVSGRCRMLQNRLI